MLLDEVELAEIVAEVERARRHAPGLSFEVELEPCAIRGVPERLARAVHNLLDNAAKWSPDGSTVEVTLADGVLAVRDHGPGFAPGDLPFVFDRFYRARSARSQRGSGLGLAIVRQTAEAHGAEVGRGRARGGAADAPLPGLRLTRRRFLTEFFAGSLSGQGASGLIRPMTSTPKPSRSRNAPAAGNTTGRSACSAW